MNKSPFVYKQTRQVFTMAMCEYLQHLGHRIAIWSVNPYVQVPQSRNFKIENISNENSIASLQLHDPSCILTKQDLRYVQTSKLSCLRTQPWALLEFCEKPLVVNQWQNWRTPQKKSNPEMGNQRLRTLRTSGWWDILLWPGAEVASNSLQVSKALLQGPNIIQCWSTQLQKVHGHQGEDVAVKKCRWTPAGVSSPGLEEHLKRKNWWNFDMLEDEVCFRELLNAFVSLSGWVFTCSKIRIVLSHRAMQIYFSSIPPISNMCSSRRKRNSTSLTNGALEKQRQKSRGAPLTGVFSTT